MIHLKRTIKKMIAEIDSTPGKIFIYILAIACLVFPRVWDIKHPSFSYDELTDYKASLSFFSYPVLFSPISEGYLNGQCPFFTSSLLYKIFGTSELTARVQSVIISLLSLSMVFLIVTQRQGYLYGLLAMMLLGLSPLFLSASRLAFTHGHIFCTFPILVGLFCLLKLCNAPKTNQNSSQSFWLSNLAGGCFGIAMGCDLLASLWVITAVVLMHIWAAKPGTRVKLDYLGGFILSGFFGLFLSSPMYVVGFPGYITDLISRLRLPDSLSGYLWLGHVVNKIPFYYYGLVLLTKTSPLIILLIIVTVVVHIIRFNDRPLFIKTMWLSLWPILYISLKNWKSPYYLIPFLPVFYILMTDGLQLLFSTPLFKSRLYLKVLSIIILFSGQIYTIIQIHPDYLMSGIEYSNCLYGEFQGPAVSHGQWIGEAFDYVKKDCQNANCMVYAFDNVSTDQIKYYSRKHGIVTTVGELPPANLRENETIEDYYILINQDSKQMVCPNHKNAISDNKKLVSFAESSKDFKLVKTFYSGSFPMLWIYKLAVRDYVN